MAKALTERRKGDRTLMADSIESMLKRLEVPYTREEGGEYPGARCIQLTLNACDVLLTVEFDGDSPQPDVYVLSWHMAHDSIKRLNDATFGGSVNQHHKCKATYVAYGFDDLCVQLEAGLLKALDGTAFL